jgi:hypothetical protein
MKNKKVIVHIGTRKTGTSSIQKTLGENRVELIKHNIYYPSLKPFNHISIFTPIFLDAPEKYGALIKRGVTSNREALKACARLQSKWINEFNKCECDNFIISAESLTSPVFALNAVRRLKEFLEEYFEEIVIVVYFRHYNSFINSQVQQVIKNGHGSKSIGTILNQYLDNPNSEIFYSNNIKNWVEVFGYDHLIIKPFDIESFRSNSLVEDFLYAAGLNTDGIDIQEYKINESLGKNSIAFLERLNQKYPALKNNMLNPERGLNPRFIPVKPFQDCPDEKFALNLNYTEEQAKNLNKEIDYVNQFFDDEFKFKYLESDSKENVYPSADDIPVAFFVELINNYNKRLEEFINKEKEEPKTIKIYLIASKQKHIVVKNLLRYIKYRFFGLKGFDKEYYVKEYPQVKERVRDPLLHFLVRGVYRGYNPNPDFDIKKYIKSHPKLIALGGNALIHYNRTQK